MRKRLRAAAQAIPFGAPVSATLVARLGTKWTVAFDFVLLAGAVFMVLIIWGTGPFFVDSWNKDYYIGVEGMFTAPVWPVALIIVVAVAVTMVQFLIMLADHWRQISTQDRK